MLFKQPGASAGWEDVRAASTVQSCMAGMSFPCMRWRLTWLHAVNPDDKLACDICHARKPAVNIRCWTICTELQLAAEGKTPAVFDVFCKYMVNDIHGTTIDGDVVFIVRAGMCPACI
eukprot:357274-Chlamydomonas_euryale.AAC.3